MIRVHHLEKSRSHRILWLLEALGLEYDIEVYQRDPKTQQAPDALKKVHPLGKSPVITDGELTVAESGAIIDYLVNRYGEGHFQPGPDKSNEWVNYRYWMHYAEGSLMPLLVMQLVLTKVPQQVPWLVRPVANKISAGIKAGFIQPRLKDHIAYLEAYLSEHDYFAGDFSFADIQMSFPLQALQSRTGHRYPQIAAYLARVEQRPAFQSAREREQQLL